MCAVVAVFSVGCATPAEDGSVSEPESGDVVESESTQDATSTSDTSATTDSTPVGTEPAEPVSVVEALDWSAPLIGGGSITMSDYSGQQVLLWFWAPY